MLLFNAGASRYTKLRIHTNIGNSNESSLLQFRHLINIMPLGYALFTVAMYPSSSSASNGMDKLYVEVCMRHDLGLKGYYYKPTWQEVLEGNDRMHGYVSVINDLTIDEENRLRKQVGEQECTIQHNLAEKEQQISALLQRDALNTDAISALSDKLAYVVKEIALEEGRGEWMNDVTS